VNANILPPDPSPPEPDILKFYYTIIFNYPINLIFLTIISLKILTISKNGINLGNRKKFYLIRLSFACLILTVFGAILDQFFVSKPIYDFHYSKYYPSYSPNLIFDGVLIIFALICIFISFFIMSKYILRMNKRNSMITGFIMFVINGVVWFFHIILGFPTFIFLFIATPFIAIFLVILLIALYIRIKKVPVEQ